MFPDKDWSWLYSRRKVLSEKAIENKHQEQDMLHHRQRKRKISEMQDVSISDESIAVDDINGNLLPSNSDSPVASILPGNSATLTFQLRNIMQGALSQFRRALSDSDFAAVKLYAASNLDPPIEVSDEDIIHLASVTDSNMTKASEASIRTLNEVVFYHFVVYVAQQLFRTFSIGPDSVLKAFLLLVEGCRIRSLRHLVVWRHSPAIFISTLNRSAYAVSIGEHAVQYNYKIGPFVEEDVSEMLNTLHTVCESFPWAESIPFSKCQCNLV